MICLRVPAGGILRGVVMSFTDEGEVVSSGGLWWFSRSQVRKKILMLCIWVLWKESNGCCMKEMANAFYDLAIFKWVWRLLELMASNVLACRSLLRLWFEVLGLLVNWRGVEVQISLWFTPW